MPDFREEARESLVTDRQAAGDNVSYENGQWMEQTATGRWPVSQRRAANLERDVEMRAAILQQREAQVEAAARARWQQQYGPQYALRQTGGTPWVAGGFEEREGAMAWTMRRGAAPQLQQRAVRDYQRYLQEGRETRQREEQQEREEEQQPARAPGRRTGVGGAVLAGVVGVGIGAMQAAAMPAIAAAQLAAMPFGGAGQAAADIGRTLIELTVQGLKIAGIAAAGIIGYALAGVLGAGISVAAAAITSSVAEAFGAIGRAVTDTIENIVRGFQDLVQTGTRLAETVMNISYVTGRSAESASRLVTGLQAMGVAPEETQRMFGGWQQRPEFQRMRFAGLGMPYSEDPGEMMGGMRQWYQRQPAMLQEPMLQALLPGAGPGTRRLLNMPEETFEELARIAEEARPVSEGLATLYERLMPLHAGFQRLVDALKLDILTALLPVAQEVLQALIGTLEEGRVALGVWLVDVLPGHLSAVGLALVRFLRDLTEAGPEIKLWLLELVELLKYVGRGLRALLEDLGLPVPPRLGEEQVSPAAGEPAGTGTATEGKTSWRRGRGPMGFYAPEAVPDAAQPSGAITPAAGGPDEETWWDTLKQAIARYGIIPAELLGLKAAASTGITSGIAAALGIGTLAATGIVAAGIATQYGAGLEYMQRRAGGQGGWEAGLKTWAPYLVPGLGQMKGALQLGYTGYRLFGGEGRMPFTPGLEGGPAGVAGVPGVAAGPWEAAGERADTEKSALQKTLDRLEKAFQLENIRRAIQEGMEAAKPGELTVKLEVDPPEMSRALEPYLAEQNIRAVLLKVS